MNWNKQIVDVFLQMPDRSIEEDKWELVSTILVDNNNIVTDDEKLLLARKPKNLNEYCIKYPHIIIAGYNRTILHYYPF